MLCVLELSKFKPIIYVALISICTVLIHVHEFLKEKNTLLIIGLQNTPIWIEKTKTANPFMTKSST